MQEELAKLLSEKKVGVEIRWGKHLAFKIPDGKLFVRCDSLGDDYSEAAILERISTNGSSLPK